MEFLARDKKVRDGAVRFVLLKDLGKGRERPDGSAGASRAGALRFGIMKNETLELLKKSSPLLVASLDGDDLPYLLEEARSRTRGHRGNPPRRLG